MFAVSVPEYACLLVFWSPWASAHISTTATTAEAASKSQSEGVGLGLQHFTSVLRAASLGNRKHQLF